MGEGTESETFMAELAQESKTSNSQSRVLATLPHFAQEGLTPRTTTTKMFSSLIKPLVIVAERAVGPVVIVTVEFTKPCQIYYLIKIKTNSQRYPGLALSELLLHVLMRTQVHTMMHVGAEI